MFRLLPVGLGVAVSAAVLGGSVVAPSVVAPSVVAPSVVAPPVVAPPVVAPSVVARRSEAVASSYRAPVTRLRVVRGFELPPTPYSAGHRGVDLRVRAGQQVVAAGGGRVSFAGDVAGRGVVVVDHPDGVSTEYEPVTPLVRAGQSIDAGQPLGRVRGTHGRCAPGRCLHWGARRAGRYFDPLDLLAPLGPVRLLPWTGPPD